MYRYKYSICNIVFLASLLIFISACTENDEKQAMTNIDDASADSIFINPENDAYSSWDNYYRHNNISFSMDSFMRADTIISDLLIRSAELDKDFYEQFSSLIVYNEDSTLFLDAYSYSMIVEKKDGKLYARGGEVDNEVSVVNPDSKTRTRIFFCGPSCIIQKVFWHNKNIAGIMGLTSEDSDEYYTPVVWFVNVNNGVTIPYYYNNNISLAEVQNYQEEYLKSKGIIQEY